ncbi:hypothetical protein RY831_33000, partial [Noviherbaspirillum sp. CPCC 100848]|nr:hypothetical protein [Noviherbaspirillum sp. CPCC 100848]
MTIPALRFFTLTVLAASLAACGGGGSDAPIGSATQANASSSSAANGTAGQESSMAVETSTPAGGSAALPGATSDIMVPTAPTDSENTSPVPAPDSPQASLNYTASTATIANPERGFHYMSDCDGNLSASQLQGWRTSEGMTMAVCSV